MPTTKKLTGQDIYDAAAEIQQSPINWEWENLPQSSKEFYESQAYLLNRKAGLIPSSTVPATVPNGTK